ncbi:hypothetical protein [Ensifer adhaerens]|uniref:hypothetical protein n=1 Tax=Ensifer adhaerens TaxID=106592 RepID=UPI001F2FF5E1|nr:hypothetical protein [Ensifer adhaerens]MDF8357437.1 hypothetical protein [Ensifer adhaerens]
MMNAAKEQESNERQSATDEQGMTPDSRAVSPVVAHRLPQGWLQMKSNEEHAFVISEWESEGGRRTGLNSSVSMVAVSTETEPIRFITSSRERPQK